MYIALRQYYQGVCLRAKGNMLRSRGYGLIYFGPGPLGAEFCLYFLAYFLESTGTVDPNENKKKWA